MVLYEELCFVYAKIRKNCKMINDFRKERGRCLNFVKFHLLRHALCFLSDFSAFKIISLFAGMSY